MTIYIVKKYDFHEVCKGEIQLTQDKTHIVRYLCNRTNMYKTQPVKKNKCHKKRVDAIYECLRKNRRILTQIMTHDQILKKET